MKMKHLFAGLVATLALGAATTAGFLLTNKKETKPVEAATTKKLYLDPNIWNQSAGERYYGWLFGGSTSDAWYEFTSDGSYYSAEVANDYTKVIFLRSGPSMSPGWTKNTNYWNRTGDQPFGANNLFTVNDWGSDNSTGSWSTYTPIQAGVYLRGSVIGWGADNQVKMTATGNANEYSITRNFAANEEVQAVTYATTGGSEAWDLGATSVNCNHPSAYPVSKSGEYNTNAKVTNAGNYTLKLNTSTKAYSFEANDFVTPSAQIAYSNGSDGETSTYSSATEQSEILVYLNQGESFTVKHVTSFGTFYRGYDNLETGDGSSRNKNDVTKGSLKEGSTYYINVAKSGLYLLYVKDTGAIWMQDAEPGPAAYNWATYFLANVGCDANGVNLPSGWSTVSARYSTLTDEAKALIVGGTANENGDELGQALARYDYAVTHHAGLSRFITGRTISSGSGSRTLNIASNNEVAMPAIVAVTGLVTMTAVGGFFFLKKKPF